MIPFEGLQFDYKQTNDLEINTKLMFALKYPEFSSNLKDFNQN